MNIQGFAGIAQTYGSYGTAWTKQGSATAGTDATTSSKTQVSISDQAKALASSDSAVADRLEGIKAKPAVQRTAEDTEFLQRHDTRLAEIAAKDINTRTADEVDYVQKAGGFVNTMANLSPQEKKLYDELVASGNTEAARGMNLIAMSRMNGGDVTLPNGATFDPTQTDISVDNIRKLFSQMFVGADGQDAKSFDALAKYLDSRLSAST